MPTKLENQAKFNIKLLKQKNAQEVLKEGLFGACKTILDRKAMRWFLLTILPFVVLTIISSQIRSTNSTETIYVPQNFCELDKREECVKEGKCIRYDPRKFKNSPSVMTYFPGGRMGNMITAYLTLLWMKLEFNYDVYLEKQSYLVSNNCTSSSRKKHHLAKSKKLLRVVICRSNADLLIKTYSYFLLCTSN